MSIVTDDSMIKTAKNDTAFTEAVDQEIAFLFTSHGSWALQASGTLMSKLTSYSGDTMN